MAQWRSKGTGPEFVKLGAKVAYPLDKLVEWENRGGKHPP